MQFPTVRMRRLRTNASMRALVRETVVLPTDLVMPLFVVHGTRIRKEISSMPGQYHYSIDECTNVAKEIESLGIPAVLLFGIPDHKDEDGSVSCGADGIVQQAVRALKETCPQLLVITDLCFCEYTSHGHCGVMQDGVLQNDETLALLKEQALSHAQAGADVIAPSGMIDGMVGAIRTALDEHRFVNTAILSYAAKFASAFYGPFREAAQSAPSYGDRKAYQMDAASSRQAVREAALDIEEGADIVMVKPALAYLDVVWKLRQQFDHPIAAYQVSGEYAMIKAAGAQGWIDEPSVMAESLLAVKRAGADIIITYYAMEFARRYHRSGPAVC